MSEGIFNLSCALYSVFDFRQSEELRGALTLGTLPYWCRGHQPDFSQTRFAKKNIKALGPAPKGPAVDRWLILKNICTSVPALCKAD